MSWKVEYGDVLYRIIAPNGEESRPVHYCCVANMEFEGRVFACYMNGDEGEDETAPVYDITDWPTIVLQPTESLRCTLRYGAESRPMAAVRLLPRRLLPLRHGFRRDFKHGGDGTEFDIGGWSDTARV